MARHLCGLPPPPPSQSPLPPVYPPLVPACPLAHPLVPEKKTHQYHIAHDRNCEMSLSELICTSFVLTHCTPQTPENVPSRHGCALCPFYNG